MNVNSTTGLNSLLAGTALVALLAASPVAAQSDTASENAANPPATEEAANAAEDAVRKKKKKDKSEGQAAETEQPAQPKVKESVEAAQPKAEENAQPAAANEEPAAPKAEKAERKKEEKAERKAEKAERKKKRKERKAAEEGSEPAANTAETQPAPVEAKSEAAAATAVTADTQKEADGTETIVRKRRDGATVTITRDASGKVIRREVEGGGRKKDDLAAANKRDVVDTREIKLDNGGTRTVQVRDDGSRLVVVRDADGNIVRRTIKDRDGRDRQDFRSGNRRKVERNGISFGIYLPFGLKVLPDRYVVEVERAEPEVIEDVFLADPVVKLDRRYSIDDVRYDADVRNAVRRIDIDTINFRSGEYRIPPDQIARLDRIASVIQRLVRKRPGEVFLIEGHTDAVGNFDYNLELSQLRAEEVKQALVDSYDIPPDALVAQGYGEQYLKVETDQDEARNRRVSLRRITRLVRR